jgi:hypothetical protein
MSENQPDIFTEGDFQVIERRKLLPWWIKLFIGIFLILGLFAPVALIWGMMGYYFKLSLYGLETNEPISLLGILLVILFGFKGLIAYTFLKEKRIAVILAIIDALIGIFICFLLMVFHLKIKESVNVGFRLELIILIPYLFYMVRIRNKWQNALPRK